MCVTFALQLLGQPRARFPAPPPNLLSTSPGPAFAIETLGGPDSCPTPAACPPEHISERVRLVLRPSSSSPGMQTACSLANLIVLTASPDYKAKAPFADEKSNIVAGAAHFFEHAW